MFSLLASIFTNVMGRCITVKVVPEIISGNWEEGIMILCVGALGSGKSTLLRILQQHGQDLESETKAKKKG